MAALKATRPWTEDELAIVRERYEDAPLEVLSVALGRSQASIRLIASVTGLQRKRGRKPKS